VRLGFEDEEIYFNQTYETFFTVIQCSFNLNNGSFVFQFQLIYTIVLSY